MSSVGDPPPSIPTTPPPPAPVPLSTQLHHAVTVTGQEMLANDRVTINDYMVSTKTAAQNSKELLQDVEQQQARLSGEQGLQLALEASSYARLINALRLNYDSFSVGANAFHGPTQGVNSQGASLNGEIADPGNQDAVTAYNQAVADFAAAQTAFDASAKTPADTATYNAAVANFNAASASYNNAMTSINADITSYNTQVNDYNQQVITSNQDIDAQNMTRAAQGLPPLTPRANLPLATAMPTGPTLPNYPPGPTAVPSTVALPVPVTDNLIDYSGQSFGEVLDSSGLVSEKDAFENFVKRTTDFQNYTTQDLTKKPQKQLKGITQPDAYIKPEEATPQGAGGSGTAALAVASSSPGEQKIQSVLTKVLMKQLLSSLNLPANLGVQQSGQAIASIFFANTLQSAFNPNSPAESLLVSALATLASGVAQSQSGATEATITAFVQNAEEFKNLNAGDKKILSQALAAAVQTAVLTLGAAGLANQLGGGSALGPALATARIQANPSAASEQFIQAQKALDDAKATFGNENVAATAGKLSAEELTKEGVNSQTAFHIGTAIGSSLVQNGFGTSQQGLAELVQNAARSANNGQSLPDEQVAKLARALLLLGLGSAFQLNAQGHLVQKLEPETATHLVEQATIRLFGFSANFSQATISRRDDEPKEELSFSREIEKQINTFRDLGDQKTLQVVARQLDSFNKTVDDLGSFLTDQFMDPGNTFQGLMYGPRGTEFRRGQVDVNE